MWRRDEERAEIVHGDEEMGLNGEEDGACLISLFSRSCVGMQFNFKIHECI